MTQEEQEILLQDLCARLPYDVKVWVKTHHGQIIESDFLTLCNGGGYYSTLTYEGILNDSVVKPYLRPLSAITDSERKILIAVNDAIVDVKNNVVDGGHKVFDYLNSIHVDYRGLIPMGLALEAPEGMYNSQKE